MVEITLQLPDRVYRQAKEWAAITQQELDVAITDALSVIMTPVYALPELDTPITALSDAEVMRQADLKMPVSSGQRMSALLAQQSAGTLSAEQSRELFGLFQLYQRLWLRQSEALAECVQRGLRPPLHA